MYKQEGKNKGLWGSVNMGMKENHLLNFPVIVFLWDIWYCGSMKYRRKKFGGTLLWVPSFVFTIEYF